MTIKNLRLTVAVLTYRRPDDLAQSLPALARQIWSVSDRVKDSRLLIIDNSPEGGARTSVVGFASSNEWSVAVDYANETTPGISHARNRALAESLDSDLLVFIDDDERPSEDWLALLLNEFVTSSAAAVVGPVVSEFEVPRSDWIVAGRFFDRRRLPTGTVLTVAATNNLLLDLRVIRSLELTFDPRLALDGGEDTLFTRELVKLGGLMVWCDEAVVVDVVPGARITRDWVVKRALSSGNSWTRSSVTLAGSSTGRAAARVRGASAGLMRMAGGTGRFVAGCALLRLDQRARGVRTLARGTGMMLGAFGVSYQEYARKLEVDQPSSVDIARR